MNNMQKNNHRNFDILSWAKENWGSLLAELTGILSRAGEGEGFSEGKGLSDQERSWEALFPGIPPEAGDLYGLWNELFPPNPGRRMIEIEFVDNRFRALLSLERGGMARLDFGEPGPPVGSVEKRARGLARSGEAGQALCIRWRSIRGIMLKLFGDERPETLDERENLFRHFLVFLTCYAQNWAVHPAPFLLRKGILWFTELFDLPGNMARLDVEYFPRILFRGTGTATGYHHQDALLIVQGGRLRAVLVFELFEWGIRKIEALPSDRYAAVFREAVQGEGLLRAVERVKYELWDDCGWISWAIAVEADLLPRAVRLASGILKGKSVSLVPAAIRLRGEVLGGRMAVYPNAIVRDVRPWVEKEGRVSLLARLVQIPFRRKRPRSRNLLYVRETILAAVCIGLLILIISYFG